MFNELKQISWQGLWQSNPALVQLLGLCPLLAVTATISNALGLGLATMLVLIGSNCSVSLIRHWVNKEIRIPVFVMIIAAFVTAVELLMNAYTYELYQALGIFIPLIVTNCAIIGRAEAFASKNGVALAAWDGFMMGLGFTLVLLTLGTIREVIGQGTLFDGMDLLLGNWAKALKITLFEFQHPMLVAILPPGAFFAMGFLVAAKNIIDQQLKARQQQPVTVVERVRVTTIN